MNHYSHRIWNMSHYGAYHLFGHSHGTLDDIGRSMDVGLNTHNCVLYSRKEIHKIFHTIPIHIIDQYKQKENK